MDIGSSLLYSYATVGSGEMLRFIRERFDRDGIVADASGIAAIVLTAAVVIMYGVHVVHELWWH